MLPERSDLEFHNLFGTVWGACAVQGCCLRTKPTSPHTVDPPAFPQKGHGYRKNSIERCRHLEVSHGTSLFLYTGSHPADQQSTSSRMSVCGVAELRPQRPAFTTSPRASSTALERGCTSGWRTLTETIAATGLAPPYGWLSPWRQESAVHDPARVVLDQGHCPTGAVPARIRRRRLDADARSPRQQRPPQASQTAPAASVHRASVPGQPWPSACTSLTRRPGPTSSTPSPDFEPSSTNPHETRRPWLTTTHRTPPRSRGLATTS